MQLVDQAVDSPSLQFSAVSAGPLGVVKVPTHEAVYANELSVPADSTLDLNGLHLYVGTAKSPERW